MSEAGLPELSEIPRTLLWTLHCRASFAERGMLDDPEAIRLGSDLGPELRRTFGRPDPAFAKRAQVFDAAVQAWLDHAPGATVVSLGEGLETQRHRVRGYGRWVSVDLPEVIALRDRYLAAGPGQEHLACSATELRWLDAVDPGAFVIAQGLFMYLDLDAVRKILGSWSARATATASAPSSGRRGALMFDVVPPWVYRLSRLRPPMTAAFRVPPMAWGASPATLRDLVGEALGAQHQLAVEAISLPSGPLPIAGRTWAARIEL